MIVRLWYYNNKRRNEYRFWSGENVWITYKCSIIFDEFTNNSKNFSRYCRV